MLAQNLGFEVDLVKVGTTLPEPLDTDETLAFELLHMGVHALARDADVASQPLLTWEAEVVVPCVGKQQRVD